MSTSQPPGDINWIELAKIVASRIKDRKDVEWKLVLQHYGALAAVAYAVGTYLKPQLMQDNACVFCTAGVLLAVSFVVNCAWIYMVQDAHAYDAHAYRHYMDRANKISKEDVNSERRTEEWSVWLSNQIYWSLIHFAFAIIVHGAVILALCVAIEPPKTTTPNVSAAEPKQKASKPEATP